MERKRFGLAGKLHGAVRGLEKAAEHFDGGGFSGAVGAEESVNFAVVDLQADVVDGGERAELLGETARADADLAAKIPVRRGDWETAHRSVRSLSSRSVATKVFSSVGSSTWRSSMGR